MLFRKMHCHVWNTFILLAFLLSSCCLSPVEDEVVIDVCQDVSMETVSIVNVIDTFYRWSPEFFFANSVMFDKEPRGKFLLHSHGYACKIDSGNMLASLAEAAWYLGMERNRDLVRINFDSLAVKNENDSKLSSDYARAISVGNIPTYNVQISKTQSVPLPVKTEKGMIGFGSWGTEVEFKDIRIEAEGRVLTLAAATGMDENTAEEPKRIYPRESEFREFGEQFDYEFLPFSYTVMRIKTQKR